MRRGLSLMSHIFTVAAFDFDGTLTYSDTLIPFLRFAFGTKKTFFKLLKILPRLSLFLFGALTRQEAKELIMTSFLKDYPLDRIEELGEKFAKGPMLLHLKKEAVDRFYWHKNQGHTCVLISANLSFFIYPWAEQMGFNHKIASKAAVDLQKRMTGKLDGPNCYGKVKTERLQALLGPKKNYILYAYGDSRGDKELLELADFPFYRTFA